VPKTFGKRSEALTIEMLDTVVLTLDGPQFEVLEPDRFSPSAKGLLAPPYYSLGSHGNFSCVQNPTRSELQKGRYGPRLTLTKRKARHGFALTLRIEFSAPKLIFGNNFDELESRDFAKVLAALDHALSTAGIEAKSNVLHHARVSSIHYSKNIAFTDYTTCSMVMSELELIDLTKRLDLSRTDYRNEGHAIRYHANSFEVTFYDKLKDLEKACYSEKRGVEKDYGVQLEMFRGPASLPRQLEVLRMEVRLGARPKIRSVLNQIGADVEPTFEALFDARVAKGVLMQFWTHVKGQLPLIDKANLRRPEDMLSALAAATKGRVRLGKLLQQLGCAVLVNSVGLRGANAALSRHCSGRTWQRYKRELKDLSLAGANGFISLRQVDEALARFQPLRMKSLCRSVADQDHLL
jgi:hypothetical protein